jgi:hypothetical protein
MKNGQQQDIDNAVFLDSASQGVRRASVTRARPRPSMLMATPSRSGTLVNARLVEWADSTDRAMRNHFRLFARSLAQRAFRRSDYMGLAI